MNDVNNRRMKKDTRFQKGNELWKLARKPGRKTKYTPTTLLKKAIEYFEYCDSNPIMKHEALKGGKMAGEIIAIPTNRPYTEIGFYSFAGIDRKMFRGYESKVEFNPIVTYIQGVIRTNQIEGALVGVYNANIVARLQGLTERKTLEIARLLETMEDKDLVGLASTILNITEQ